MRINTILATIAALGGRRKVGFLTTATNGEVRPTIVIEHHDRFVNATGAVGLVPCRKKKPGARPGF